MAVEQRYLNCEYIPENSYDESEDGITYTWNDFLNIAKGNEKLAMMIVDLCDWQYPETELDDLLIMEEIAEHNGEYIVLYDDDVLKMLWKELGDVPFDENENMELVLTNKWLVFEAGTDREYIWEWFDEHYSKGVHALMFPSEH